MPPWMYKKLGSLENAPMVVSMPRDVGNQFYYDLTHLELVSESPHFLTLENNLKDDIDALFRLIKQALKRYRV